MFIIKSVSLCEFLWRVYVMFNTTFFWFDELNFPPPGLTIPHLDITVRKNFYFEYTSIAIMNVKESVIQYLYTVMQ